MHRHIQLQVTSYPNSQIHPTLLQGKVMYNLKYDHSLHYALAVVCCTYISMHR